jgi:hypothetical protein
LGKKEEKMESNKKKLFKEFKTKFQPISTYLLNYNISPPMLEDKTFMKNMRALEVLVLDRRFDKINNEISLIPDFDKIAKKHRILDEVYEIFLETKAIMDFMVLNIPFQNNFHLMRDYNTAVMEGRGAKFNSNSYIVFIGSGPFPSTAISYM